MTIVYFSFLLFVILLGVAGPHIAPYEPGERIREGGELVKLGEPTLSNPLGTNDVGYDILSRMLYGAAPTITAGLLGGIVVVLIGSTIGITAGYVGGRTEEILMRITDIAYGVPLIPFAVVLLSLLGLGFYESVLVISMVLWRGTARVLRAQVLSIKERPFILAAKSTGASTQWIIFRHILPNVSPMAILFFSLSIGYVIVLQAGLAFLGVVDPFVPSWGIIMRNAYASGRISDAWWWSIPPGLMLSLTVLSSFMFGRSYERIIGGTDQEAMTEAG